MGSYLLVHHVFHTWFGIDSFQTFRRLRDESSRPHPPIVQRSVAGTIQSSKACLLMCVGVLLTPLPSHHSINIATSANLIMFVYIYIHWEYLIENQNEWENRITLQGRNVTQGCNLSCKFYCSVLEWVIWDEKRINMTSLKCAMSKFRMNTWR